MCMKPCFVDKALCCGNPNIADESPGVEDAVDGSERRANPFQAHCSKGAVRSHGKAQKLPNAPPAPSGEGEPPSQTLVGFVRAAVLAVMGLDSLPFL